jgi:hypothetical protein
MSFDTYDIEDTGSAFNPWRDMVKQVPSGPHSHFGDYVLTEDACKRIAELERNQRGLSEFATEVMDWWAQQPASEAYATPPLGLFTMVEGLRRRIASLEPYRLACLRIHQWIGCEDQEVDEAVVRRVEGDARKLAALEAREAELVGALTALHQSVVDWNAAVESVIGRKPYDPMQDAMKLAGEVLAKGRKEVGDE